MKSYLHLITAAGFFIPLLAGAQMPIPPYSLPFSMNAVTCPSPFAEKKWAFTQFTASKDTGKCVAGFSADGGDIPVNNWQSYLRLFDSAHYTVGAGIAACQKAACTLHIALSLPTPEVKPCFR